MALDLSKRKPIPAPRTRKGNVVVECPVTADEETTKTLTLKSKSKQPPVVAKKPSVGKRVTGRVVIPDRPRPAVPLKPIKKPVVIVKPTVGIPRRYNSKKKPISLPEKKKPEVLVKHENSEDSTNAKVDDVIAKTVPVVPVKRVPPVLPPKLIKSQQKDQNTKLTEPEKSPRPGSSSSEADWEDVIKDQKKAQSIGTNVIAHARRHSEKRKAKLAAGRLKEFSQKKKQNKSANVTPVSEADDDVQYQKVVEEHNINTRKQTKAKDGVTIHVKTTTTTTTRKTVRRKTEIKAKKDDDIYVDMETVEGIDSEDDYEKIAAFLNQTNTETKPISMQKLTLARQQRTYVNIELPPRPPRPPKPENKPKLSNNDESNDGSSRYSTDSDCSYVEPDAIDELNASKHTTDTLQPKEETSLHVPKNQTCVYEVNPVFTRPSPPKIVHSFDQQQEIGNDDVFLNIMDNNMLSPQCPPRGSSLSSSLGWTSDSSSVNQFPGHDESPTNQKISQTLPQRGRNQSRYLNIAPMFQVYQDDKRQKATRKLQVSTMKAVPEDDDSGRPIKKFQRTMWKELSEVRKSGVLHEMNANEIKHQESMFEVISSEASYLRSLNVFVDHFMGSVPNMQEFQRRFIFSNIKDIRDISEKFLMELEARQEESIVMSDVCDIIEKYAIELLHCYVVYCSNHSQQLRTITELRTKDSDFSDLITSLEKDPVCENQTFSSFLTLPMQRITRLPLLVQNIFHRTKEGTECYDSAKSAFVAATKVVRECNEGARKIERIFEMVAIEKQLKMHKQLALVSASRWLVKKGELTEIRYEKKFISSVKPIQKPIYLFLFTDLLLIARKKGNANFVVEDHCLRNMLQARVVQTAEDYPKLKNGVPMNCNNLILLVLLENYRKKEREILLNCAEQNESHRWMDVLSDEVGDDDDYEEGREYEEWDCPQVQCFTPHTALESDEISLEVSDVVNVYRKLPDGWYYGARLRDGETGWFPSDNTEEILNQHVRAKNLKQRYKLLCASELYMQTKSQLESDITNQH
uniref:Ephexin-1-like n=1 Tax=Saccoglossus kowalevskii TaxID=10224 RepID=A0ABM0LUY2_SACKO|nr:PREDICTED: ephexin-1-like [Saccoglossus kowalevskii]